MFQQEWLNFAKQKLSRFSTIDEAIAHLDFILQKTHDDTTHLAFLDQENPIKCILCEWMNPDIPSELKMELAFTWRLASELEGARLFMKDIDMGIDSSNPYSYLLDFLRK